MFIEKLDLVSFKGFKNFTLKCLPFTTLVGLNNNGKTSILQAIQFIYDIFIYTFGGYADANIKRPDISNPQWGADPSKGIIRLNFSDPDSIWLNKKTTVPCEISLKLTGDVEVTLKVSGKNRYQLDVLVDGTTIRGSVQDPQNIKIIEDIFTLFPTYVPPVAGLSPAEIFLTYPQLTQKLDKGLISECWRANLYWLYNDGNTEDFRNVIEIVQRYLPEAIIRSPKLSHDGQSQILVEFDQDDITFDISTSGGGLRTILSLAVILYFSRSKCLLLDEPDAHLHSSLQKKVTQMLLDHSIENNVQIFMTSHAPDIIAEVPTEYLVWIDRTKNEGRICDSVGRFLADLGAMSKADAIRAYGVDKILFVEGSIDRNIIYKFVSEYCHKNQGKKNFFEDNTVIVAILPNGKGDKTHLLAFQKLLGETFRLDVKIVCITDNDYDLHQIDSEEDINGSQPLLLALQRKEIENYLLDNELIAKTLKGLAENRQKYTGEPVMPPNEKEIDVALTDILNARDIRSKVKCQLVPKYIETLDPKLDPSTKYKSSEEWFEAKWEKDHWRRRNCPGKEVLAKLRSLYQEDYSLTLTTNKLISNLQQLPEDILKIIEKVQEYFYRPEH